MLGSASYLCHILVTATIFLSIPAGAEIFRAKDVLYGRIGTDITLVCNAANDRIIQWKVNGTLVALANDTKVQHGNLMLLVADLPVEGNYSCYDKTGRLLHWIQLKLGYPPSKPLVHCMASNFYRISCSWEKNQEAAFPTSYIATYRAPSSKVLNCPTDLLNNICQIDNPQIFASLPYVINITAINPVGYRTTLLEIVAMEIVQPDPPANLTAEPVFGSPRRIKVQWDYPPSWGERFELKFILEYKLQQNHFWSRLETKTKAEIITDAIAAQMYVIRVKAKDSFDNGKWSDWSSEVLVMTSSETSTESIQTTVTTLMTDFVHTYSQPTEPSFSSTSILSTTGSDVLDREIVVLISVTVSVGISIAVATFLLWIRRKRQESDKNGILTKKALPLC
ncbi:interleukin-11 receptor subunit alpha [Carcharodon carcharias]|uniref:interleukin-11 receptor subunit alpha n=1 Tax=Carcharodon carcharias TaxID=13397 RepID=UPI001B7E26A7|nr:interleukin-11 receptor subunit alpha [Carcharodon carcharias]XP_041044047.1 interleukin-11 receptor subunit alpha [Carcharodon carcharias]